MQVIHPTRALPRNSSIRKTLREVRVDQVVDQFSGGTQSRASVARVEGELKFLKSQVAHGHGRYANFEADLLAEDLFSLIGVKAPRTEVVRLSADSPLRQELGPVVLAMDYVCSDSMGHQKVARYALLNGLVD